MDEILDIMTKFSDTLKELLTRDEITVAQLSRNCNISKVSIGRWLALVYLPDYNSIITISEYFGCSIDYLVQSTFSPILNRKEKPDTFINRLEFLMSKEKIGMTVLAKECGFKDATVSKWRHGSLPKLEKLVMFSKYFNCSIEFLVGRADNP